MLLSKVDFDKIYPQQLCFKLRPGGMGSTGAGDIITCFVPWETHHTRSVEYRANVYLMSRDLSWTSEGSPFETGSPILREAPPFLSNARHTEHGGEDLSLSELYLDSEYSRSHSNRHEEPFSLLAQNFKNDHIPDSPISDPKSSEAMAASGKQPSLSRRDQLQRDLFLLKKLNASMSAYITAIGSVSTATKVGYPSSFWFSVIVDYL